MDDEQRNFFMMSVEIRILASVMARISARSQGERFNTLHADISGLQYGILRTLSYQSYTLSELSRRFVVDPSTLVPTIDTLERKGWVTRQRDVHDRRRIHLSLSPDGAKLIENMPMVHEDDLLFKCLGSMGEDKARDLRQLLREVVQHMPEGEEMLQSISSRLYDYRAGENVTQPPRCVINPSDQLGIEHKPVARRTIRRRVRRSHSSQ